MIDDPAGDALFALYLKHKRAEARAASQERSDSPGSRLSRIGASKRRPAGEADADSRIVEGGTSETVSEVERRLREHWSASGRDPVELERRLREIDYRESVLALFVGPARVPHQRDYQDAVEMEKSLQADLRNFWLAGGHDLTELGQFLSSVDADVDSLIVK
jgi:hypothetical protein